jgi:hypothetical protein
MRTRPNSRLLAAKKLSVCIASLVAFIFVSLTGLSNAGASLIVDSDGAATDFAASDIPIWSAADFDTQSSGGDEESERIDSGEAPREGEIQAPSPDIQIAPPALVGMLTERFSLPFTAPAGWGHIETIIAKPIKSSFELLRPPRLCPCFA